MLFSDPYQIKKYKIHCVSEIYINGWDIGDRTQDTKKDSILQEYYVSQQSPHFKSVTLITNVFEYQ